jgi:anti-anti-sigma factor
MAGIDPPRPAEVQIESAMDASGHALVTMRGDLDISNAQRLERTVSACAAREPARLVFDLGGLRFIDSAGIAVLLHATERVPAVTIRKPSPAVRRVLEITGLTTVLEIEP